MAKVSVLFARFPFGNAECPDSADWMIQTVLKAKSDPRVLDVHHMRVDDTPITMGRNRVLKRAFDLNIDLVCMIDSDMRPDLPVSLAKPFWDTSFEFVVNHHGPCMVAAPYCGPPPWENVYVFKWSRRESDHPSPCDKHMDQFTREEAYDLAGIQEVAAAPTGLILIDMRALKHMPPPWFEYEYKDAPYNTEKASTEDVFFTRNASLAGIPVYCNWDAWAGHWKRKCVGKPSILTSDSVRKDYHEAIASGRRMDKKLIEVRSEDDPAIRSIEMGAFGEGKRIYRLEDDATNGAAPEPIIYAPTLTQ